MIEFDEDIFNPKRFAIMTVLFLFREMTEGDLAKAVGISWGSLSSHLKRLEEKGYVERKKVITSKGIRTVVRITRQGYLRYKDEVEKLRKVLSDLSFATKDLSQSRR
jgi:DNA-binding MarR family transcriptional regulator